MAGPKVTILTLKRDQVTGGRYRTNQGDGPVLRFSPIQFGSCAKKRTSRSHKHGVASASGPDSLREDFRRYLPSKAIGAIGRLLQRCCLLAAIILLSWPNRLIAGNPLDVQSAQRLAGIGSQGVLHSALIEAPVLDLPTTQATTVERPEVDSTNAAIADLEQQVLDLQTRLDDSTAGEASDVGIDIGGAVRFQYTVEDYVRGNPNRGGDLDFDIFRIDFDGEIGGVLLSAQYRWFQYMNVIHHAWAGYDFNDQWQVQLGITRVPFGNLPFNSHNFFFSTNYYVGLEDDYDAGIKLVGQDESHDFRVAFFKNDEMGGIDGFVDNRTDRYSYDVVGIRAPGEAIFDPPATEIAEHNGWVMRYTYDLCGSDVGASFLVGRFRDRNVSRGNRWAYAVHSNTTIDRWNLQFQFSDYDYDVDDAGLLVVGAYSFYDTIPARARLYTANLAYRLPVHCGPVTELLFYNDFNVMADKSGGLQENTLLNVAGVAVSAVGLYTFFDLLSAKNQPFVGGSLGDDAGIWNTRFNINVGYYF